MKQLIYCLCLLIALLQLFACHKKHAKGANNTAVQNSDSKDDATSLSIQNTWFVESFPLEGKPYYPNNQYKVSIDQQSLGIRLEVNQCGLAFSLNKTYLQFKEAASCTEACCDSKEGQAFVQLLKGKLKYSLNNHKLSLYSETGPIVLLNKSNKLTNSSWTALHYTDKKEGLQKKFEKENTLTFEGEKAFLQLDVNRCHASFKLDERASKLDIGPMGCSRKCCDSKDGSALAQSLHGLLSYTIEGRQLTIETNDRLYVFKKNEILEE
jgi:heat shock protein HslJ